MIMCMLVSILYENRSPAIVFLTVQKAGCNMRRIIVTLIGFVMEVQTECSVTFCLSFCLPKYYEVCVSVVNLSTVIAQL